LALDEPNDNDAVYDISGFKYVVDKVLLAEAKPIKIDFMDRRFNISSSMELGRACGSCSTASPGCS
jgi:Fe-S cluster assembly iron-binding protein IscA